MTTNLEAIHQKLEDRGQSEDIVWILIPRFALEVVRGRYHQHYYELSKIANTELRDHIQEVLDEGEAGMSDVLLMADFMARLDAINGALQDLVALGTQHVAAMYTAELEGLADVVSGLSAGASAWDDTEIAELIDGIELIGAAL